MKPDTIKTNAQTSIRSYSSIFGLPVRWLPLIALLSGGLMGLTPAPVNAWWFAWVAIVPLWILVVEGMGGRVSGVGYRGKGERGNSRTSPVLLGLLWGIGYHGLALSWILGVHPMTWMGVPWLASLAIAIACWILITLWGAVLVALWVWLFTRLTLRTQSAKLKTPLPLPSSPSLSVCLSPSWLRVLIGTALWCSLEALWSYGSLYWTSLSYTQSPYNLAILHLGQLSGALSVTAAIVAFNGLLAEAWIHFQVRYEPFKAKTLLGVGCIFLVAVHLLGFALYSRPLATPEASALKVGIIQGNIPNTIKLYEEGWRRALEGYTTGYRSLADQGVDAVLTPETALPIQWTGQGKQYSSFYQAVLEKGIPVWLGAFGKEGRSITNSLFTVSGNGETLNEYRKVKLVPLGEYIPFEQWLGSVIDRLSPLDAHMQAGTAGQRVDTPFGRAIVGICYESAFPDHFRQQAAAGGQFILTASNNAHYSWTMPAQHHAQDVMRAIETDRWAVRATNTGYSGIVDPHGRTIWISGINTYETHSGTVYRRQSQTLYVRWGDWLTPLLLISALMGWGVWRWGRVGG